MPIQYSPFPELQVPNVNVLGALQQGEAARLAELQAAKTAQAMELAGQRDIREAAKLDLESKVKLQELNEKIRSLALSQLSAVPEGDQEGYLRTIGAFKDIFPSEYEVLSKRKWDADTRKMVLLTPEQQYKQTTKDITLPSGQTQTMRYSEFGGGASSPIGGLVSAPHYEPVEDKNKNIIGYRIKGTTRVVSPEEATAAPASDMTTSLIKQREGFQPTGKWDVNANRAGYGSDTVTLPDGTVQKVTKGMRVSQEDAERDLQRRIQTEFVPKAAAKVGEENWARLPENVRASLTSIAYNYGTIPSRIVPAVQSGNPETIARAIESLAGDNKGINAGRRMQEANIARGTAFPGSRAVPAFAAMGSPEFMSGPQIQPPINMMAPPTAPINAMAAPVNAMAAPAPIPAPAPLPPVPSMELKPKRTFAIGTEKAAQQKAALETLQDIAINPDTGNDRVSDLIRQSTSGGLQTGIAGAIEYMTGEATEGMEAIAALKTTLNDTVLARLGGSLGAQISDKDREFIEQALGDIANPRVGSNARLRAWNEVKRRLARYADVDLPTPAAAPPRGKAGEMTAPAEKPAERKRIKFMDLGD
jgi:GH24 family phage-related lysozyme (muramidase)